MTMAAGGCDDGDELFARQWQRRRCDDGNISTHTTMAAGGCDDGGDELFARWRRAGVMMVISTRTTMAA